MSSWNSPVEAGDACVGLVDMRIAEHGAPDLHAALVGIAHAALSRQEAEDDSVKVVAALDVGQMRAVEHGLLRAGNVLGDILALRGRCCRVVRADDHQNAATL